MDIINIDEDINSLMKNYIKHKKKYKTNPQLTKYERTRVSSERASQINSGSTILISNPERFNNAYLIASEELIQNKIPFIIKRRYGNNYEYWKLGDLHL